jgi:hypothetical protein
VGRATQFGKEQLLISAASESEANLLAADFLFVEQEREPVTQTLSHSNEKGIRTRSRSHALQEERKACVHPGEDATLIF